MNKPSWRLTIPNSTYSIKLACRSKASWPKVGRKENAEVMALLEKKSTDLLPVVTSRGQGVYLICISVLSQSGFLGGG